MNFEHVRAREIAIVFEGTRLGSVHLHVLGVHAYGFVHLRNYSKGLYELPRDMQADRSWLMHTHTNTLRDPQSSARAQNTIYGLLEDGRTM